MRWSAGMSLSFVAIERHGGLTVTSPVEKRQGSVAVVGRVAPIVLGDEEAVAVEERLLGDELERLLQLAGLVRGVRRIEKDPAEGAAGLFVQPAHHRAAGDVCDEAERVRVVANEVASVTIDVDEERATGAARQRLEAERARAGVEIEDFRGRIRASDQDVEDGLAHLVRRRARARAFGRLERATTDAAANDAHGALIAR